MGGYLEVKRSGSFADAAGSVVVRSVARTVVAPKVSSVGYGDAAQVSADSDDDEPLGLLGSDVVVFRVAERFHWNGLFGGDFGARPVIIMMYFR